MLLTRKAIADSFQTNLPVEKKSIIYHIGLLLVTIAMVLLPCIYILLIITSGYGIYYYNNNPTLIDAVVSATSKIVQNEVVQRTFPIIFPTIIVFVQIIFLALPIVSSVFRFIVNLIIRKKLRTLNPKEEPLIYYFVDQICKSINSPTPKRINITPEPNASASFRNGLPSIIRGDDLVLTIGLPLITTLNVQQLGGIVAHECGHFSQRFGFRLHYIIYSINNWFARVVYERGAFEVWVKNELSKAGVYAILGWISLIYIWITRIILWIFMKVGRIISSFMSRQMEFDADRFEIRIAGKKTFETNTYDLRILQIAWRDIKLMLYATCSQKILVDNLMGLIRSRANEISSQYKEGIVQDVFSNDKSNIFDIHPSDKNRIINARNSKETGILHLNNPAEALFSTIDIFSREVSSKLYRELFGSTKGIQMLPVDKYIAYLKESFPELQ